MVPSDATFPARTTIDEQVEELYRARIRRGEFAINDLGLVIDMIFDAMAELPELAKALGGGVSGLLTMPQDRQHTILAQIIDYLAEPHVPTRFTDSYFGRFCDRFYGTFVRSFNAPPARNRKRVLFLADQPDFGNLRKAMFLRRIGYSPCLIFLHPIPEKVRRLIADLFDLSLLMPAHLGFLGAMLERLDVELMHIQTGTANHGLPLSRFAIERKPNAATVCEFSDIPSICVHREARRDIRPDDPLDVELDYAVERFVCRHADAVIMRPDPATIAPHLRARWGIVPPAIQMWPYPAWEFAHFDADKYSKEDGVTRLVFVGGIQAAFSENSLAPRLASVIRKLLAQGVAVDMFLDACAPLAPDTPDHRPLLDLMRENPRFRLLDGAPPHLLSKQIARYDFGFYMFDIDLGTPTIEDFQLRTAIPTAMLSYLEAGLPVLMGAEFSESAKFVTENGIGIAIKSNEIGRIAPLIDGFDCDAALERIKQYFANHGMEREIPRLKALYDTALAKKGLEPPVLASLPHWIGGNTA